MTMSTNAKQKSFLTTALIMLLVCVSPISADETTELFSNLVPVEDPRVAMAYIDPEADFSVFKRVMILDTFVAFRSNWRRDQNRGTRGTRVSARDMDRIKGDVATLFNEVLAETLQANDGYDVVAEPGDDVLLIRAAIIDLDITAPDTGSAGRTRSYTASSGAATLYIELYDSVSGQIVGRAADRQAARGSGGWMTWTNRVTNTADARRVFRGWADRLREFLDSHYSG
jgi:hypothetical protein